MRISECTCNLEDEKDSPSVLVRSTAIQSFHSAQLRLIVEKLDFSGKGAHAQILLERSFSAEGQHLPVMAWARSIFSRAEAKVRCTKS